MAFFSARFIQWVKPQGLEDLLYSILLSVLLCIICVGINNIGLDFETGAGAAGLGAGVFGALLLIYNIVKYKIFHNIIMSLVHLSSIGQRPYSFYNQFPNGIQLGTNASVCLVGYSGQLDGEVDQATGEVYSIVVNKGQNDTLVVQHADLDTTTGGGKDLYYAPQTVTIPPKEYNNPADFATAVQLALNESERFFQYKGGWTCTYGATFLFTITCGSRRAGPGVGGKFINYIGGNTGVVNAVGDSLLTPYQSPTEHIGAFIDTEPAFIGDNGQALGIAAAPLGITMEFTTIGATTGEDIGYSLCYVAKRNATKMSFLDTDPLGLRDTEMTEQPDPDNDFAYGPQGNQSYGYCPHGMTIRNDGQIGIIEAITGNMVGNSKAPNNWNVTWTAHNINLGAPGLKKLGMSPKWNPGTTNPVMEYAFYTGGVWAVATVAPTPIDGPRPGAGPQHITYQYDTHYYAGVVVDPITAARATSLPMTIVKAFATAGPFANPREPIEIALKPYDDTSNNNYLVQDGGMGSAARFANHLGETLGFPEDAVQNTNTAQTVGFISTVESGKLLTNGDYSSLLITCPSLPITGYIGGAIGTTSPLLAVGRVNGNSLEYGFSGETAENWIELRNTRPLTLYRLKIEVKTETNNDYLGLEPNFAVWMKFKSNTDHLHLTSPDVMGVITN